MTTMLGLASGKESQVRGHKRRIDGEGRIRLSLLPALAPRTVGRTVVGARPSFLLPFMEIRRCGAGMIEADPRVAG